MRGHDIIVMGASAGGVEALTTVISALPSDLPASVFVVLHMSPLYPSKLPDILRRKSSLPVEQAGDGEEIKPGNVYVAPPDHHLILEPEKMLLVHGPKENNTRPAIDPLFRSAAKAFGPRVVGVVLTGQLSDGTAGCVAIKERHGITIAQDPKEAAFADMPKSAMALDHVDYVLSVTTLPTKLIELASLPVAELQPSQEATMPADVELTELGKHKFEEGKLIPYRCHVGHGYTADVLADEQSETLEIALWTAVRTLEEQESLSRRIASKHQAVGRMQLAERFLTRAEDSSRRSNLIKSVLQDTDTSLTPAEE